MICWKRVAELRDEVGIDDFNEVVMMFLEEVQESIDRLAAADSDVERRAELHFLKGSALNLGFSAMSDFCSMAEQIAETEFDLGELVAVFDQSKAHFSKGAPETVAA